jgi:Tol biopolymer transport system component
MEGAGYLSLDGSRIICLFNPESEPTAQLHPWIINLASWETKRLTNEARVSGWDGSVSWHPNSQEIVFVRLERTTDTISSTLMQVSLSAGIPVQLLGPDVGVMAACYASDGMQMALLTSKGLEIAKTTNMERSLVLPWSSLPNAQFRAGGLVWAREHNLISFAIFNKQTKRYEIWTVSPDGSSANVIYSQNESQGRIGVTAIIRT